MSIPPRRDPRAFYDDLAESYDLIFEDWEASMQRQGEAIYALFEHFLPGAVPGARRRVRHRNPDVAVVAARLFGLRA